ncbi:MAG: tRNA pseudouridine(55) synthase TruB [Desulfuromonadaceae bacterium]|nr:tRNA pseudouridine(55) synthase TruB [Desulfuromonas sp.]MDY0184579.1 tRNA pseudouridine(55) synthase TruB [Desulfuromonadaceae bacterium]
MHGFLALDKPEGMSSHTMVQQVRRACGTRRVGHAGTLDPLATGVLLVGVGHATRLIEYLTAQDKSYRATMRLGTITDSQDITGTVVERREVPALTSAQIENACCAFTGQIDQVPPMFSALKRDGVPLYRLARKGEEVERQKRTLFIRRIELISHNGEDAVLDVECSKGTYIRTLCHDIGEKLGCGACMAALRRTGSGFFTSEKLVSLDELRSGNFRLLSVLEGLAHLPQLELLENGRDRLRYGIPPLLEHICDTAATYEKAELVLLCYAGTLVAVASPDLTHQHEQRGDFKLHKVFPDGI